MRLFNFLFKPVKSDDGKNAYKFTLGAKITTLWIIAAIVIVFLYFFAHILPVFIWAAVTAYIFAPIVIYFTKRTRTPKALWIVILYIVVGVLVFLMLKSLIPLMSNEISDLASGSLEDPNTFLGRIASQKDLSFLGFEINLKDQVLAFENWIKNQFPLQAIPLFFGTVKGLVLLLVYFVVSFYFLLESGTYTESFKKIIPSPYKEELSSLLNNINQTLGSYLRSQVVLILIMSIASFTILAILKVKYALVLSLATGILEVIPIAGPILATAIVATVALFQIGVPFGMSNTTLALIVMAAYFALRQVEDYFIIPNVVSRFVKVHPVLAIFSLMVGGSAAGVLGLFLAIPAAAILKVISEYLYQKMVEAQTP